MENKQKNFKQCDMCKDNDGTSFCFQCFSYFCDKCFKWVHEGTKNSEHKKENIDVYVPIDTRYPAHNGNNINLFCIDDKGKYINIIIIWYRTLLCLLPLFKSS